MSLCADPLKPNNLFIGDCGSIRYWDSATDQVTLIAGDKRDMRMVWVRTRDFITRRVCCVTQTVKRFTFVIDLIIAFGWSIFHPELLPR